MHFSHFVGWSNSHFLRRTVIYSLCCGAFLVAGNLEAAIYINRFTTGVYGSDAANFPGGPINSITGTIAFDSSIADVNPTLPWNAGYFYYSPTGPYGITITTNTGKTFASNLTDSRTSARFTAGVVLGPATAPGTPYSADQVSMYSHDVSLPAGWTASPNSQPGSFNVFSSFLEIIMNSTGTLGFLNGSDAQPTILPSEDTFGVDHIGASLTLRIYGYNTGSQSGSSYVMSVGIGGFEHVGTIDNSAVTGGTATGSAAGGSSATGGVIYDINSASGGTFQVQYLLIEPGNPLPADPAFLPENFFLSSAAGGLFQTWNIDFTGQLTSPAELTFSYDPALDGTNFGIWHFNGSAWEFLGGVIDQANHTITVQTTSFSPFAAALAPTITTVTPEPASLFTCSGLALLGLLLRPRRRRKADLIA